MPIERHEGVRALLVCGRTARRLCAARAIAAIAIALAGAPWRAMAADEEPRPPPPRAREEGSAAPARPPSRALDVLEYRVEGAEHLAQAELEAALEPFLGPGRTLEDVEKARAALERAYSDRGFQSVTVAIPQQTVRDGVVTLRVTEGRVGRLRVRGTRYFSPRDVKRLAPSVAEGAVPNYDGIVRDVVALNQLPDRRVTPALRPGAAPGTVDVDLNVKETLPLHGSLELNNRYSANTTQLRLNGALRYDNLWQLGHSLGLSFQVTPVRFRDAKVFTGSYVARLARVPWLTFSLNGFLQDSAVSTLGGIAVNGKGHSVGARAAFTPPAPQGMFHTVSAGFDYKHFQERISLGSDELSNPITYWPFTAQYGAAWPRDASQTQLNVGVTCNVRGLSSGMEQFDAKRYKASGSFLYVRGDLSRTDELAAGFQLFGRVQGQWTDGPLLGSEQLTAGGAESVRGYLESQAVGDYGAMWTVELRSPSLARWIGRPAPDEWRIFAFGDGSRLWVREALPDQQDRYLLWSVGAGSSIRVFGHLIGSVEVGVPLVPQGETKRYQPRLHFRLGTEF